MIEQVVELFCKVNNRICYMGCGGGGLRRNFHCVPRYEICYTPSTVHRVPRTSVAATPCVRVCTHRCLNRSRLLLYKTATKRVESQSADPLNI